MDFKVSNFRIRTPGIPVAFAFLESTIPIEVNAADIITVATKNHRISIGVVSQIGFSESIRVGEELYDYFTRDTADELFFQES